MTLLFSYDIDRKSKINRLSAYYHRALQVLNGHGVS